MLVWSYTAIKVSPFSIPLLFHTVIYRNFQLVPSACNYDCVDNAADDTVQCGFSYKMQVFSTPFVQILCSQTSDPDGQKVAVAYPGPISSYANNEVTYSPGETPFDCVNWNDANLDKSGLDPGFNNPADNACTSHGDSHYYCLSLDGPEKKYCTCQKVRGRSKLSYKIYLSQTDVQSTKRLTPRIPT